MKKIVILGCENSHADTFLAFIRDVEDFKNIEVLGIYSDESDATERKKYKEDLLWTTIVFMI